MVCFCPTGLLGTPTRCANLLRSEVTMLIVSLYYNIRGSHIESQVVIRDNQPDNNWSTAIVKSASCGIASHLHARNIMDCASRAIANID